MDDVNPDDSVKPTHRRTWQLRACGVSLVIVASVLAGLGAYEVLFTQVLRPWGLVPLEVERTMRRAELLRGLARKDSHPILVFGSSVVLEGVDSEIVEAAVSDEVPVFNIAESNAGLRNLMMNIPLILVTKPRLLVCCLRRSQLTEDGVGDLPSELLVGYAEAGYVDTATHQPAWIYERLSQRERAALPGNAVTKLLASRIFLLRSVEEKLRHVARPDLRTDGFASNFISPWRYTQRVPRDRLERLIARSRESFATLRFDPASRAVDVLKAILKACGQAEVHFLLVLTPENPLIQVALPREDRDAFDASARAITTSHGGAMFVMDSDLLSSDDFLDHLHVNASGREIFSRALAAAIVQQ